jgi:hypothetical protein
MSNASRYWNLVRLEPTGRSRNRELPPVKAFFLEEFPKVMDPIQNAPIQKVLVHLWHTPEEQVQAGADLSKKSTLAELSLRCFITSQIEQVCIQLEMQFGELHGFRRSDLLPFVLDDDGRVELGGYEPFSRHILKTFDPDRGSLTTWSIRLVKHHRELNQFLLECGVYLLSDWAILNDTTPRKLGRILATFQPLTAIEIEQACTLLEVYHQVYRRDRLLQRQSGIAGQCPQPSEAQLAEMAEQLGEAVPSRVLKRLRSLADRLRQYRIASRGGAIKTDSLDRNVGDETDAPTLLDRLAAPAPEENETTDLKDFLQVYRASFRSSLEQAIQQAIAARLKKLKGEKAKNFLRAIQLFHCQGLSMGAIADQVGLQAQYQVTRLLNLKAFREDVRHQMLALLQAQVRSQVEKFMDPDQLKVLDEKIAIALNEQVESMMEAAAAQAQTPKDYAKGSLFAERLCTYLDQLQP